MIPSAFDYARATSVEDAVAKLAAAGGAAKLLAGGHSLVPMMKLRLNEPSTLIDIARIPGLSGIRVDGDAVEVGAATVHHEVATSDVLTEQCPALAGARSVPAADFFQGLFTVDLGADEIITGIRFAPAKVAAYAKLYQRASRFAIVGVAAALEVTDGKISSARLGLTGASTHATRMSASEAALVGTDATAEATAEALGDPGAGIEDVNDDLHASEGYRRAMVSVFTRRAVAAALARA